MAQLHTGWHDNSKVLQTGLQGMGLHAWSISYCDDARTDGFIPLGAWPSLPGVGATVKALLIAGLWERVEGGFLLHDYRKYNRTRAQIEAEQQDARQRQSRHRSHVTDSVTEPVTNSVSHDVSHGVKYARAGAPNPNPGVTPQRDTRTPPKSPSADADAQGASPTRPLAEQPDTEPLIIHASAGICPLCRRAYLGAYLDHTAEFHKVRPKPADISSVPGHLPLGELPDEVRQRLAAPPISDSPGVSA